MTISCTTYIHHALEPSLHWLSEIPLFGRNYFNYYNSEEAGNNIYLCQNYKEILKQLHVNTQL